MKRVQDENGRVIIICQRGENVDEEQQWNRKRSALNEIFMYFCNTYIVLYLS